MRVVLWRGREEEGRGEGSRRKGWREGKRERQRAIKID
jgi:hypothetical protein